MIELIGFDLDDTLWAVAPVIRRAEAKLDNWLAKEYPALRYTVTEMRAFREVVIDEAPELKGKLTEFRRRLIERAMIASEIRDPEAASKRAIEAFLKARNQVEFFPGARESLQQLAQHFTLCALSNGNADIHRLGLKEVFNFAYSAEDVGAPKPEPDLFLAALAHAGLSPEQMLYVGDDPVLDVDAAKALGLSAIWINTKGREPGSFEADATISSISDLPRALAHLQKR